MIESGTVLQERFLIEKELARGGMGAVYLATDQKFGSRVAIKERFYEDTQLADAFAREARILNSLHHPMLPYVSDYFSEEGGQFLVMEYIEGEDLSEILKREGKAFPVTDTVRWMLELLDGLDFLHSQDPPIVHRDIKPGNLKLTSRGNLVLLDFGLAKETSGNNQGLRSVFGYSRRYSPLEQIEGAGTSPRSDLFSLGSTAYHLITGEAPVDVLARASAIVAGRPDPLHLASAVNSEVDLALAQVIHRAMALDPEQRYASAREMHSALYDALDEEPSEQPAPAVEENMADVWKPVADLEPAPEPIAPTPVQAPPVSAAAESFSDQSRVPAAVSAGSVGTGKKRYAHTSLGWRSMGVAGAVILLALLAIGYSVSQFRSSAGPNEEVVNANEPATSDPNTVVPATGEEQSGTADFPEGHLSEPELSQQVEPLSETSDETEPVAEPAAAREKTSVAKRDEPSKREVAKERNNERGDRVAAKAGRRTTERRDRSTTTTRKAPQRRNSYDPPVSSIEMIFTGIPPERQRERRSRPY